MTLHLLSTAAEIAWDESNIVSAMIHEAYLHTLQQTQQSICIQRALMGLVNNDDLHVSRHMSVARR